MVATIPTVRQRYVENQTVEPLDYKTRRSLNKQHLTVYSYHARKGEP